VSRPDGGDRPGPAAGDEADAENAEDGQRERSRGRDGNGDRDPDPDPDPDTEPDGSRPSTVTPGADAAAEAEPDPAPTGNLIGPVEQPDLPEVARYESRVRADLESSLADADEELKSAFVACVVLLNLAVFGVSLGLMLVGFRGNWRIGGALVAVGLVAGLRAYRRYRRWEAGRGDADGEPDPDPGSEPGSDAEAVDGER